MDENNLNKYMGALLASRLLEVIEESGATQIEVMASLGIVQCLLPTLEILPVSDSVDCEHS